MKYTIKLTKKQLEAVTTCLSEWAEVEKQTSSGKKLSDYYDSVHRSILNQVKK